MSVIVSSNIDESHLFLYSKGSPEALYKIMDHTTVPDNYFDILKKYTSCGFRVLTITYKQIETNS
jgi:magnesium-transporting ATPase (P-type)